MSSSPPILRVRHVGDWSPGQVISAWAPSSLCIPPEVQPLVDVAWERATSVPGRKLFDGPMCRLESFDLSPAGVAVRMSRTSYKAFWGTNLSHPELADRFGPTVLASPIGVSPALETADGWLLMGRRNERVAYYPGRVHPFAGSLDPSDVGESSAETGSSETGSSEAGHSDAGSADSVSERAGSRPRLADAGRPSVAHRPNDRPAADLFAAVERELSEELGFGRGDVQLVRLTGLVEDVRLRQPELIFRVKATLTRARIESQLDDAEHTATVAVAAEPAAVRTAALNAELTPVAVASLLLWGRVAFGDGWFSEACSAARID